ncbi:MAG: hypothetical protein Fur0032_22830 [Terrimicrobiaceae bacterium]
MKKLLVSWLLSVVVVGVSCAQTVGDLSDLNYWGVGPNRAGIVIDWNDGKGDETLAWGFQWSGSLALIDALDFLAAADPLLFFRIDSASSLGAAIFGVGYQVGISPFGVSGALDEFGNPVTPTFLAGVSDMNNNPTSIQAPQSSVSAVPVNPVDHYKEGWNDNGFWSLYFQGSDNYTPTPGSAYPTTWTDSYLGVSGTPLINDGWYALSITEPDFTPNLPGAAVAAVPEPSALVLVLLASCGLIHAKKRLHVG